jgi:hypothetical protein
MDVPYPHPSQAASLRIDTFLPIVMAGALCAWGFGRVVPAGWLMTDAFRRRRAIAVDIAIGMSFGLLAVLLDRGLGISEGMAAALQVERIHLPWPYSLPAYFAGAVAVETLYRLIPLTAGLWLVPRLLLRGRGYDPAFWTLAAVTALTEPLSQAPLFGDRPLAALVIGIFILLFNLIAVIRMRSYGVVSPLVLRLSLYGVWHVTVGPALLGH